METRRRWLIACFLFIFGDAVALQSRGALLASFEASFAVSEGLLGLVAPAGTVGFVLAVLAAGFTTGRLNLERSLLLGALGTAILLFLLAVAPVYSLFLLALVGQGAAAGIFRGLDRAVLSHLYPLRRGWVFNLHALAWAIGAVAGPLLVSAVLRVTDWRVTYLLLGVFFLAVAAFVARLDLPDIADERELSISAFRRLLRRPKVFGMGVAMLLLGGIEGGIFTWLPYYAAGFFPREVANAALSVYLVAYIPGRTVYSAIAERVRYVHLIVFVTAGALPALFVAFSGVGGHLLLASVFVAGFFVSGLFPTLSAYGVEAAPEYSGPINAISTGATYAGIAVAPAAMGVIAERVGIETAMLVPVALTAGTLGVVSLLLVVTRSD